MLFNDALLGLLMRGVAGDVQDSGPAKSYARERRIRAPTEQKSRAQHARQPAIVECGKRAKHAGKITRCAARSSAGGIDYGDLVAALGQCMGCSGPGDAGTDHRDPALRTLTSGGGAGAMPDQHFAFTEALLSLQDKVGADEAATDLACRGPGGQCGAGSRKTPQLGDHGLRPQIRIAIGRKSVEVDCIGDETELQQDFGAVAKGQGQDYVAKIQAMQNLRQGQGPLRMELRGERSEFRPVFLKTASGRQAGKDVFSTAT